MVQAIVKDPIFPGRKSRDATAADLPAANRKTEHTGRGASPGPCVQIVKNFEALPIQADQDKRERGTGKRKQENAVGANIDQLTIYRYGA